MQRVSFGTESEMALFVVYEESILDREQREKEQASRVLDVTSSATTASCTESDTVDTDEKFIESVRKARLEKPSKRTEKLLDEKT